MRKWEIQACRHQGLWTRMGGKCSRYCQQRFPWRPCKVPLHHARSWWSRLSPCSPQRTMPELNPHCKPTEDVTSQQVDMPEGSCSSWRACVLPKKERDSRVKLSEGRGGERVCVCVCEVSEESLLTFVLISRYFTPLLVANKLFFRKSSPFCPWH